MRVQAFQPELAVESCDEAVIRGLAGAGDVQGDVVGLGPQIEIAGNELAAVVDPDRLRVADTALLRFQGLDDIFPAIGEAGISGGTKAGMRIDDGQDSQRVAQGQLVMNKIHGPDIVWPDGFVAKLRLPPALWMPVSH